jgi:hypothetical protein
MASTPRARLAPICQGKYDGEQRDAEHAGRGIWEGSYVEPWLLRASEGKLKIKNGGIALLATCISQHCCRARRAND